MSEHVVKTACGECSNHCGLLVSVKDGRAVKVEGDPGHPYNTGTTCIKGQHTLEGLYHPDRVLYPLNRTKKGWQRISWDEALETIAQKLFEVKEKYGPLSICGAGCHTENYIGALTLCLFLRTLGSPNMMSNCDLCHGAVQVSDQLTVGDRETLLRPGGGAIAGPTCFQNAKCLFIIGGQIETSWPTQWKYLLEAKKRGAKLIVVDPRYTKSASHADLFLQIRPGTDAALALGILNVIINEELYDKSFVEKWCFGFDKLKERVQEYPLKKVEKITWVAAEKIREAARMYALNKPACLASKTGALHSTNGVQTARAFGIVVAVTGNIDIPGGNSLIKSIPGLLSHGDILRAKELRLPVEIEEKALGASQFPLWTGPHAKVEGHIHNPTALEAMITGKPYPLKAMIVAGDNVVNMYPDSRKVVEALRRLEFLVVTTQFMSPTAELADIILPRGHSFETEEVTIYVGMHKCIGIFQRVIEPLGEVWGDTMKIFVELAKRMESKGFIKDRGFLPWENTEEYLKYLFKNSNFTLEELRQKGNIPIRETWKKYEEKGFRTPSGKVEIYSNTLEKFGYDPLPSYHELSESEISTPELYKKYPLMLITSRRLALYHSRFPVFKYARKIHPYPEVEVHPQTAKERGIEDGDWICIKTPKGEIKQKAKVTDKIHPKVVNPTVGWWFPEGPAPEHRCYESNVNVALSYNPPHDPILGTPTLNGVLCEISKVQGN